MGEVKIVYFKFLTKLGGKAPKKNNYALKNEMDLNFPTQFGKKFEKDNFYCTPPFSLAAFV